jgi:hypothetical protein
MIYAFTTIERAQAYADYVQAELSKNPPYIAQRWSDIIHGSDGRYYVWAHQAYKPKGTTQEVVEMVEPITNEPLTYTVDVLPEGCEQVSEIPTEPTE